MKHLLVVAAFLMGSAFIYACGDDDKDSKKSGATCAQVKSHLQSCDFPAAALTEWDDDCWDDGDTPAAKYSRCQNECFSSSSCERIKGGLCWGTGQAGDAASEEHFDAIVSCFDACFDANKDFVCGSGETVTVEDECDGFEDCADGSDEHSACPAVSTATFTCDDGDVIPADWECDGTADCTDGSDEHSSCPTPWQETYCG